MASSTGPVLGPGLLVSVNRTSGVALNEQIESSIRDAVRAGQLAPGARLPSSRALASELGISRGVVSEAYGQLAAEGYLQSRQGAPVTVARRVSSPAPPAPTLPLLPTYAYDFHPGMPDLDGFPRDRWLRSVRAAIQRAPGSAMGHGDPRGQPELREALSDYLGRVRGTASDPEQTVMRSGFRDALALLCRWLAGRGVEQVAIEEPGAHAHRLIVEQAGMSVVPVPVDGHGLRVDALARSGASAVIVTPAHQFPTGCVLATERRAALIAWAEDEGRLIIEDDMDGELRYDGARPGALQGLAPERVVYIGSASKRLLPGLRLGWMQLPSWLTWPLVSAVTVDGGGPGAISQLALQDFITRGELDRHLRRMRQRYARRRDTLLDALAHHVPDAALSAGAGAAGLYEVAYLPAGTDDTGWITRAGERGVGVHGLSLHHFGSPTRKGFILGFAGLSEPAIEQGIRLLAASRTRARASN